MRGTRWLAILALALGAGALSGCQTASTPRASTVVSPEPSLGGGPVAEKTIETPQVKTASFADRHPIFSKPKEYWETSGKNKIVKAAAATFIGVPAGFVGEVKQIIVGAPPEPRY